MVHRIREPHYPRDLDRDAAALRAEGVEMTQMGPGRIRAVTHMDVDRAGIETAIETLREVLRV